MKQMEKMVEFLETLLRSLNVIEIRGKGNMELLLGCISAVENAISQLNNPPTEGEEETDV